MTCPLRETDNGKKSSVEEPQELRQARYKTRKDNKLYKQLRDLLTLNEQWWKFDPRNQNLTKITC